MCRILMDGHPKLADEVYVRLLQFLIRTNGGDGAGLLWATRNEQGDPAIHAMKKELWNEKVAPEIAGFILSTRDFSDGPIILHTRKASSGGISLLKTHPIQVDLDDSKWIKTEHGVLASTDYTHYIMQNGTLSPDTLNALRLSYKMYTNRPSTEITRWSDTQLLARMMSETEDDWLPSMFTGLGVVISSKIREKTVDHTIFKTYDRPLFVGMWDDGSYLVVSDFNEETAKLVPHISRVPSGTWDLWNLLKWSAEHRINDQEREATFYPKRQKGKGKGEACAG
jgi:hypothetical protein